MARSRPSQVQHLLTITGDWQKFKGLPGAEGTLKTGESKADKKDRYEELVKESLAAKEAKAAAKPARSAPKRDAKKAEPAAGKGRARPGRGRRRRGRAEAAPPRLPRRPPAEAARRRVRSGRVNRGLRCLRKPSITWSGHRRHPDDVRVVSRMLRRGNVLEVRVHPDDLGKVIGRGGRTARALRTVIGSLAGNRHVRIDLLETGEVS